MHVPPVTGACNIRTKTLLLPRLLLSSVSRSLQIKVQARLYNPDHPAPPSPFWIESYRYLKQSNFSSKTFSPFDKNLCWPHAEGALLSVCRQAGLVLPVVQH
ncbi:hypothetical protein QQF64_013126 [Cirrhinus molitorella]|uniref:Uncharacterized protein n=1 Tax=Cirrhinus molitorella TaxID=172907 RepID=A0ABR3LQ95_9TELE